MSLVLGRTCLEVAGTKCGEYLEDLDVVGAAVRFDGLQLRHAHGVALKDRCIVLAALAQNGFALSYAPPQFHADREAVLTAVTSNAFSFTYANTSIQQDSEFVAKAISLNPFVRDYVDKEVIVPAHMSTTVPETKSTFPDESQQTGAPIEETSPEAAFLQRSGEISGGGRRSCCIAALHEAKCMAVRLVFPDVCRMTRVK